MSIAFEVREELFHAIKDDGSFGYLFYILGTEQNFRHNNDPIDCVPDAERITHCVLENRDDYPKEDLDSFINDDLNYQQYNILMDGHYWDDDDSLYLAYFNRVYSIYDELRLRRQSISGVRSFLREQQFETEVEKYWTFAYIVTLIDEADEDDTSLRRCKQELVRIIEPLSSVVQKDDSPSKFESPVYLNDKRGMKIDIIRVLNVLYELGSFVGKNGEPLAKKDFMLTMGKAINVDLSTYDKDLSRSLSDSTKLDKHLDIFNKMLVKMEEVFNRH